VNASTKKLAKTIQAHPRCVAVIDNDCWSLYRIDPYALSDLLDVEFPSDDDWEAREQAEEANIIALGGGNYGSELLEAMAHILDITLLDV
jgi:hypothetical protein